MFLLLLFFKYNHSLSNICNVTYMSHWAFMINFMLHKSHLAFISHLENKCKKKKSVYFLFHDIFKIRTFLGR